MLYCFLFYEVDPTHKISEHIIVFQEILYNDHVGVASIVPTT